MEISKILDKFEFDEEVAEISPLGNGHINSTFLITTKGDDKNYVLQKINNNVFKNIDELMLNIYHITNFLTSKGYKTLKIIKTKDDKLYYVDDSQFYRLYVFIDDVFCSDNISDLKMVENSAKAFGELHKALADFDANTLYEVIPHFHDTVQRYQNLMDAIELDKLNRVKDCLPEIETINKYKKEYSKVLDGIKNGDIHLSVTHNDTKINNVLFDSKTGEICAVIDLDTVMPGSYLYDFGDGLRFLFSGENEDSNDLSKLVVNDDVFSAYARGYLYEMKDYLTETEKELLPFSAFLLTMECGIRFLEDYIRGDVYFRTKYDAHNLVRARTQIKLAVDIYNAQDRLTDIVNNIIKNS